MSDLYDPPLRLQRKKERQRGMHCPPCVHCEQELDEARPTLFDVMHCMLRFREADLVAMEVDVDCPRCGKPNQVQWEIDESDLMHSRSLERWTGADVRYMRQHDTSTTRSANGESNG